MGNSIKKESIRSVYNSVNETPSLYPRSAKLLPVIFQNLISSHPYDKSLDAENDNPGTLELGAIVENEKKWDPFTMHFFWESDGISDSRLKKSIIGFISHLRDVQDEMPNPGKMPSVESTLNSCSGSIAVARPHHALMLLRKLVAWQNNSISATTDGANPRNIFSKDSSREKEVFQEAAKIYKSHVKSSPFSFDDSEILLHLPTMPYASREAASAMASIVNGKKNAGRTYIDIAELENAIDLDYNKKLVSLPCPYRGLH
jgi:hypothetical protein